MKAQQIVRTETLAGAGPPGAVIPSGIVERRGVQAIARGTGILARSLAEFGQQIQTAVRRDMVSHNYALAQRDIADAELNLKADPDHRSVPEKFSRALDDIRAKYSDRILDPVASNMFQRKMFEYGNTREIQMKYFTHNREVDAQKGHLIEELDTKARLIENTDINDLKTYHILLEEGNDTINQRVAGGIITNETGTKLRLEWRDRSAKMRAFRSVMSDPFSTLNILKSKSWKKFFPFLNEEDRLNYAKQAETRIGQINRAVDQQDRQARADEKALQERMRELTRRDFIKRIEAPNVENPLTPMEVLDNPNLKASDIEHFLKVMKDKADDAKSIYDTTNEPLYGQWKEKIYLNPESIKSLDKIWADHGKGLSTRNVSELSKLWEDRTKPGKEEKNLSLQRAVKTLGKMRDLSMFGDIKDEDELLEAHTKHNEYVRAVEIYVAENPDAKDKEIMEYVGEITKDDQKGWWQTWVDFITWPMLNLGAGVTQVDPRRTEAVRILRENNKAVNEETIKTVMEQLK